MSASIDVNGALEDIDRVRPRSRFARNGHWFACVVFGVVILGALPFYVRQTCRHARTCGWNSGPAPLSRAFSPALGGSLPGWSTLYWIMAGFAAVVGHYHLRARKVGVQGQPWPAGAVGLALLGLLILANDNYLLPGDFEGRGTTALLVIAVGLAVLSYLARSRPFMLFSAGFLVLALVSCLYDVVNLFHRVGLSGPFDGTGNGLPNLILPAAYLLVGGLAFLALRGRELRIQVRPRDSTW